MRAAQNIVEIGEWLIAVKEALGYGRFGGWLEREFEWDQKTAERMIAVAGLKIDNLSNLAIAPSALYLLASPSTPHDIRDRFIGSAQWSESSATKMMQVAAQFKSVKFTDLHVAPSALKSVTVTDLNISARALYLLASPSTPDDIRDRFVESAQRGEPQPAPGTAVIEICIGMPIKD